MLSLLILLGVHTACQRGDSEVRPEVESAEVIPEVFVAMADSLPVEVTLPVRGQIEPIQEFPIKPRIAGFVTYSAIAEGRFLRKGETILTLDDREWKLTLENARLVHAEKKQDFEVEMRLRKEAGVTDLNAESVALRKGLRKAEVDVRQAELNVEYATITAPFDGYLTASGLIPQGRYVNSGEELGFLVDDAQVRVAFNLLEQELPRVRIGMAVEIQDDQGRTDRGEITQINPQVDPQTRTIRVIAQFNNADRRWIKGMLVSGRIILNRIDEGIRMPRSALLERDGRSLFFKISKGEAEWIYAKPIVATEKWVRVDVPELSTGDTVAVGRHFSISHLQKVKPRFNILSEE